jgi:hypothetical protein
MWCATQRGSGGSFALTRQLLEYPAGPRSPTPPTGAAPKEPLLALTTTRHWRSEPEPEHTFPVKKSLRWAWAPTARLKYFGLGSYRSLIRNTYYGALTLRGTTTQRPAAKPGQRASADNRRRLRLRFQATKMREFQRGAPPPPPPLLASPWHPALVSVELSRMVGGIWWSSGGRERGAGGGPGVRARLRPTLRRAGPPPFRIDTLYLVTRCTRHAVQIELRQQAERLPLVELQLPSTESTQGAGSAAGAHRPPPSASSTFVS